MIWWGSPSRFSIPSTIAGNEASDDEVLNAIACAGALARTNGHGVKQERDNNVQGGGEHDVVGECADCADAHPRRDREHERENTDRGEQQHPAHNDEHRLGDTLEEARERLTQLV